MPEETDLNDKTLLPHKIIEEADLLQADFSAVTKDTGATESLLTLDRLEKRIPPLLKEMETARTYVESIFLERDLKSQGFFTTLFEERYKAVNRSSLRADRFIADLKEKGLYKEIETLWKKISTARDALFEEPESVVEMVASPRFPEIVEIAKPDERKILRLIFRMAAQKAEKTHLEDIAPKVTTAVDAPAPGR